QAIENQKMVVSQNESDIASAELALRLAEIDLKKYLEADYEQMRRDLLGQLKLAEANLLTAREHQAFTERMNRRGFSSDGQVRAERSRTNTIEMGVEALREQLAVLEKYGYPRDLADLRGKAAEARRAVDRAKEQAKAKEIQTDIDRLSKERIYQKRLTRYHEIEAEAAKCRIVAPHDGMVVYCMSDQTRSGTGGYQPVVAEGE